MDDPSLVKLCAVQTFLEGAAGGLQALQQLLAKLTPGTTQPHDHQRAGAYGTGKMDIGQHNRAHTISSCANTACMHSTVLQQGADLKLGAHRIRMWLWPVSSAAKRLNACHSAAQGHCSPWRL